MRPTPRLTDLADKLRAADGPNELAAVFFISSAQEIIGAWIDEGHFDAVSLPVAHIIERGLSASASQIMLVHTHPSGDPRPSRQDMLATKRLRTCLSAHDLHLSDHIILAHNRYFSFRRGGLL